VVENRRRVFAAFQRPVESIYDVWQVHGTEVINTRQPRPLDAEHIKADAILTDNPDVTLFMRFADCVPVLVYDPVRRVVGIIHAGWMGTVSKIVTVTIENMRRVYGCSPENIVAGIGPSIGVCHYQVGENVIEAVRNSFGEYSQELLTVRDGKTYFDLWKTNALLLNQAGIQSVEIAGLCTACHTDDWYSHRAEAGKTGRFSAVLCLNQENDHD
jgi:YfiH family protein